MTLCSFFHNPHSGLAEVLAGNALFRRLVGAGICSLFELVGLPLRLVEFGAFLRHTNSLRHSRFTALLCGFQTAPLPELAAGPPPSKPQIAALGACSTSRTNRGWVLTSVGDIHTVTPLSDVEQGWHFETSLRLLRSGLWRIRVLCWLLPGSLFTGGNRRCRAARMDALLPGGGRRIEMRQHHLAGRLQRKPRRRGRAVLALVFFLRILLIWHLGAHIPL